MTRLNGARESLRIARGIRYARAERFRLPVLEAPGPDRLTLSAPQPGALGSEDCLHLTVWSPAEADSAPVLVWIHGGAHVSGSSTNSATDGARFAASQGVVVVAVEYRLGLLGHLHLDRDAAGFADSGNLALHDQLAALRWVQAYIHRFGGDPDAVTVMGQSSGGVDVLALLASGAGAGLFARAIAHSCTAERTASIEQAEEVRDELLRAAGALAATELVDMPIELLMRAQERVIIERSQRAVIDSLPFRPLIDGRLLCETPLRSFDRGVGKNVSLLIGTNRHEALPWVDPAGHSVEALHDLLAAVAPGVAWESVREAMNADRGSTPSATAAYEAVLSQVMYRLPTARVVASRRGALTYEFVFDPDSSEEIRAGHSDELPMLFGDEPNPPAQAALSHRMMSSWGEFVRHGRPQPEEEWAPSPGGCLSWGPRTKRTSQSDPNLRALLETASAHADRW